MRGARGPAGCLRDPCVRSLCPNGKENAFQGLKSRKALGRWRWEISFVFPNAWREMGMGRKRGFGPVSLGWTRGQRSRLPRLSPRGKSLPPLQKGQEAGPRRGRSPLAGAAPKSKPRTGKVDGGGQGQRARAEAQER